MQPLYITTVDALPIIDTVYETVTFDMKTVVSSTRNEDGRMIYDYTELAKDIAAFANSIGGIILVGAQEEARGTGRLKAYRPIPEMEAKEIRAAYNTAARDHCRPSPDIRPEILPKDDGYIVAVNVQPFFSQPVGVKIQTDKGPNRKSIDAWFFPLRIGVTTQFLNPEQLHMLMLTDVRRAAYLISSIPRDLRDKVYLRFEHNAGGLVSGQTRVAKLVEFNIYENTVSLQVEENPYNRSPMSNCLIPLDAVRHVWNDGRQWNIAILGTLDGSTWGPFILRRS